MNSKVEILKAFEREPNKAFSTTMLVETAYPQQLRSIRDHIQFGTKQQKHASQLLKSKLHRQVLYYLGKLVEEGVLEIARIDAHGEKIYKVAKESMAVASKIGTIQITQQTPRTHLLEQELESGAATIFEQQSVLSRTNAFYIDCTLVEGLGHLTKLLDITLRVVNDVVCLGDFQVLLTKYRSEDLHEFINTITLLTLDEAKAVCILLDTRSANVSSFVKVVSGMLPKRLYLVFVTDHRSIITKDFLECIESLQERHEKVNIHFAPMHPYPLFIGSAGPYGIQPEEWLVFKTDLAKTIPGFIVSQASVMLDMKLLQKKPAHEVRTTIMNAAKTLHSLASQQRLVQTGVSQLQLIHPDTFLFFQATTNYLRFWNYNWEASSMIMESVADDLQRFTRTQETIYRACGLPFPFHLQLSSAFSKFRKNISSRAYRKWMITTTKDLEDPTFKQYQQQRISYLHHFKNVDRFRVFRAGTPQAEHISREALIIGQAGFPLITIDFKQLQTVRKLTEYFG